MATLRDTYAPCPQTERGKPTHLGADPTDKRDILFCCGSNVFIRNSDDLKDTTVFKEHGAKTTVVRKSPSGYYYASADIHGNCKIWGSGNQVIVLEKDTIGTYTDLQWDGESKRIAACGIGRALQAEAFMADTGSSLGSISGHAKPCLSIAMKPNRPFRVVSVGEDFKVNFYAGPPFKFDHSNRDHKNYVNCVRYSPDGSKFVTVSSDKQGIVYDGKTGEKIGKLSGNVHKATIYSVSWNDDGTQFVTTSADKTARIWDAESLECVQVFEFEKTVDNMLVGSLWQGDKLITLSLNGDLTYLNVEDPTTPLKVVSGHQKKINSIAVDAENGKFYSADMEGNVIVWDIATGETQRIKGESHNGVLTKAIVHDGNVVSIGTDATLKISPIASGEFAPSIEVEGEQSPRDVVAAGNRIFLVTGNQALIFENGDLVATVDLAFDAVCLAVTSAGDKLAIGDTASTIHVYNVEGTSLNEDYTCTGGHTGDIASMAWNPEGTLLASGGGSRKVACWDGAKNLCRQWVKHTSRVNCIAWSPDGQHVVSGGVDNNVIVWSLKKKMKKIEIKDAHGGGVSGVAFLDDNTVVSTGDDMTISVWDIVHVDV